MPQASDELRNKVLKYFSGDNLDPIEVVFFLEEQGWKEVTEFTYQPPVGRKITQKEWDCINFLVDEWDYGYKKNEKL